MYPLVGPEQHRSGGWQLPLVGGQEGLKEARQDQQEAREAVVVLPRSWPEGKASQEAFGWAEADKGRRGSLLLGWVTSARAQVRGEWQPHGNFHLAWPQRGRP